MCERYLGKTRVSARLEEFDMYFALAVFFILLNYLKSDLKVSPFGSRFGVFSTKYKRESRVCQIYTFEGFNAKDALLLLCLSGCVLVVGRLVCSPPLLRLHYIFTGANASDLMLTLTIL